MTSLEVMAVFTAKYAVTLAGTESLSVKRIGSLAAEAIAAMESASCKPLATATLVTPVIFLAILTDVSARSTPPRGTTVIPIPSNSVRTPWLITAVPLVT